MLLSLPEEKDGEEHIAGSVGEFPFSIDGYEIHAFVGGGGMGRVYRATRKSDQREVAVKVLNAPWLESQPVRERFKREAELTAAIGDPRTVSVIESGLDRQEHIFYYAMEFVEGAPIDRFVRNHQLGEEEILRLVIELCEAVSEAHQVGIIHRDLKPENVLVTENSEIRVLDFGLARFVDSERGSSALTVGQIMGTPGYMAPETTDLSRPPGVNLDVFSLGVILSNLLGADLDPKTGSIKLPTLDRDLEAICSKAIEYSPADRYRSVDSLRADLECYLKREPVQARPLTRWSYLRRWVGNHPLTFTAASIGTLVIVALAIGMTVFGVRESRARAELQAQSEIQRRQMVELLLTCDPANLEGIYETLSPRVQELRSLLKEHDSPTFWSNPTRQARIDALLSRLEPERLEGLKGTLLRMQNLHEVRFLAKLLLPYREELSNEVWDSLISDEGNNGKKRLAMATALAVWDPDNLERWKIISPDIAVRCSQRANQKGFVDDTISAFFPVRQHLRPHFATFFNNDLSNPFTAALYAGMLELEFRSQIEELLVSDDAFREGIVPTLERPVEANAIFKSLLYFHYRWIGGGERDRYARCVAGELLCGGVKTQAWGRLRLGFRGRPVLIEKLRGLGVPDDLFIERLKLALEQIDAAPPSDKNVGLAAAIIRILASPKLENPVHLSFLRKTHDALLSREKENLGKNEAELREALESLNF